MKAESSAVFRDVFRQKRVLVTGHTGFKGAWLTEWLIELGAEVCGLALSPPAGPSLFEQLRLEARIRHVVGDIRESSLVTRVVHEFRPEFVFHLAAQPLVRLSYEHPIETLATNIMGTAHVLDSVRSSGLRCVVVAVTTDKCYENREWVHSYREEDPMGGFDPYSASKGAAELIISAYRRSYFAQLSGAVRLASVRAGNVIGGGDWARDRIMPDSVRALSRGEAILVRNKVATRPWQHVLEPLCGYLWLGALLAHPEQCKFPEQLSGAFNFGPPLASNRTVAELVQEVLKYWAGAWTDCSDPNAVHEAKLLNLSIDKAYHVLGWRPIWTFEETVARTISWYRESAVSDADIEAITQQQIRNYTRTAFDLGLPWTQ